LVTQKGNHLHFEKPNLKRPQTFNIEISAILQNKRSFERRNEERTTTTSTHRTLRRPDSRLGACAENKKFDTMRRTGAEPIRVTKGKKRSKRKIRIRKLKGCALQDVIFVFVVVLEFGNLKPDEELILRFEQYFCNYTVAV